MGDTPRRTLIVNPGASRATAEAVARAEARLRPVETLRTERRGHATELARGALGDEVWVLGGDGAVNEVVNGLRQGVALGLLPGGHSNVLHRALGGRSRRISLGRVNGRRFTFAAGIGVDADVVREMETVKRADSGRRPGDLAYARAVASRLMRGYSEQIEIRGLGRAAIVFVSNGGVFTYAGPVPLRVARQARFELGLDLVAPEEVAMGTLARLVPRLVLARGFDGARGVLSLHDADRIELVCDAPLALQADGEDLGDVHEAVFEAERDAVLILV
jgi:diacylglycerol kinase family enzyme